MTRKATLADTLPHADLTRLRARFPAALIDRALAVHTGKRLRADWGRGTASNRDGFISAFVAYDWSHVYEGNPAAVFADYFEPCIGNSCARMERGLTP